MTKRNRVDPWGELRAVPAKGAWLGNRGILHDDQQQIVAPWRHKSWVTCRLNFAGIKREIFAPGSYSELFFLDEATALAAGHRPCAECRRQRYNEFKELWCMANLEGAQAAKVPIAKIDERLHAERAAVGGKKCDVPDGVPGDSSWHDDRCGGGGISFLGASPSPVVAGGLQQDQYQAHTQHARDRSHARINRKSLELGICPSGTSVCVHLKSRSSCSVKVISPNRAGHLCCVGCSLNRVSGTVWQDQLSLFI